MRVLLLVIALTATIVAAQQLIVTPTINQTTGLFKDCPPEGIGGDPILNQLKNRDKPASSSIRMTIAEVRQASFPLAMAESERDRKKWEVGAQEEVVEWEGRYAVIEGFLIYVNASGAESCNCGSETDVDIHLNMDSKPATGTSSRPDRSQSMVVEISPRTRKATWTVAKLKELRKNAVPVRVKGWLMWDQEHHEQLKSQGGRPRLRATLWEIHPIHSIEYRQGSRWKAL